MMAFADKSTITKKITAKKLAGALACVATFKTTTGQTKTKTSLPG